MNRRFTLGLGLGLAVIAALVLRVPQLDRRPMHCDEAVDAIKFRGLWEKGRWIYDPNEFHGPTLAYTTLALARLVPDKDFNTFSPANFRAVPLVFGVGLLLLLALLADGLGRPATLGAAALTAISPAMVFYSRYYIHEMLLVFFTGVVLAAGWRYSRTKHIGWGLLAGAGLGLMWATKETFVLAVGAMGLAWGCVWGWERFIDSRSSRITSNPALGSEERRLDGGGLLGPNTTGHRAVRKPGFELTPILAAFGLALLIGVAFFSSFFTNATGPLDSVRTYLPWLGRAGGNSPHIHPWYFYLQRLGLFHLAKGPVWSEALILFLAGVGIFAALTRRGLGQANVSLVRLLAFYTVILTSIYSVISYKTPWCLLGFLHPMILLAGVGVVAALILVKPRWMKWVMGALLLAAAVHLGWQAWRASFPYAADRKNPYVYAHTSEDLLNLVEKVEALARFHARRQDMLIKVMAADSDYWPLPWYLRRFNFVGWWDRIPADPLAPVMIVSSKFEAAFDDRPEKTHLMVGFFQLRPQVFLELYVELNLWRAYVQSLPPNRD